MVLQKTMVFSYFDSPVPSFPMAMAPGLSRTDDVIQVQLGPGHRHRHREAISRCREEMYGLPNLVMST